VTGEEEARESRRRIPRGCVVVPNGVHVPLNASQVPSYRELRLMYLGRLHPKKGIENLLQACALLPANLDWSLDVIGAGDEEYETKLRQKIAETQIQERVHMRGMLLGEEKARAFENCDLAVFPSYTENFGLVVAEALSHGVPVITSKGMPWSRVEKVGCGAWIDNDPESIAAAISRMSSMPLREMGERGREWMRREFSWDDAATKLITVYRELIANSGRNALEIQPGSVRA
jgi:glycosyltransferase involved in cell wall biosynthesis